MQTIKLTNNADLVLAAAGAIPRDRIRTVDFPALVDTGASTLVLPAEVVARLGLIVVDVRKLRLADGTLIDSPRVGNVHLEICGRDMLTSALVLPAGTKALVGQIPLEELDLVVDPKRQILIPNPEHPDGPIAEAMTGTAA